MPKLTTPAQLAHILTAGGTVHTIDGECVTSIEPIAQGVIFHTKWNRHAVTLSDLADAGMDSMPPDGVENDDLDFIVLMDSGNVVHDWRAYINGVNNSLHLFHTISSLRL